mgnify:CR=1 FL=1
MTNLISIDIGGTTFSYIIFKNQCISYMSDTFDIKKFKTIGNFLIIKSELDIVARKDGRSKNLYMRKRNANGKAIYTYISLKTKDKVDAKKLARKLFEENIRGAVTFANDTIGFVDYATKAKDNFDYRYKNGLISEQHADLSKRLIDRYAISFFGSMQLQNIKSKTLMNFVKLWITISAPSFFGEIDKGEKVLSAIS